MTPAVSSTTRWCPTPEQLMILEEMYRSGGVRTPNATQIQQITAHLSYYGKIEGKNVFYWFQNHKARDRQKLRRKLISKHQHQQHQHINQLPQHQQHQQQIHINQLPQQQQHQHQHQQLVYYIDHQTCASSSSMALPQQFSHSTPTNNIFPQAGIVGHEQKGSTTTKKAMSYTWKTDKMMMLERMYGQDWSMMKTSDAVGPTHSSENRPVMRTLELFPTQATNLKEECSNNNKTNTTFTSHYYASLFN